MPTNSTTDSTRILTPEEKQRNLDIKNRDRSSTLDAEMNIRSLSRMDEEFYGNAQNAISSIGNLPATRDRLSIIVDEFRNSVLLKELEKEQNFLNQNMNVVAQNFENDFPQQITELGKEMLRIMKSLGYNHGASSNFILNLFKPLYETYMQEISMSNANDETRQIVPQALKNLYFKKQSSLQEKQAVIKLSYFLRTKGLKPPFKIKSLFF